MNTSVSNHPLLERSDTNHMRANTQNSSVTLPSNLQATEETAMSNEYRNTPATPEKAPTRDADGHPVNVVERDIHDRDDDTRLVDEIITPTSTRAKEQEVEELKRKTDEIERKVADGN